MPKRMLIDASHPEETRVVVLDGQKVEEFDFEAATKRPLKGNIYLAKVTRVEPSLQAAFVEYGGNRQGFLAFSEIHPDYYQIPVADRMALLAEQEADARRHSDDEFESFETASAPAQNSNVGEYTDEAENTENGEHADNESVENDDANGDSSDEAQNGDSFGNELTEVSPAVPPAAPETMASEEPITTDSSGSGQNSEASSEGEAGETHAEVHSGEPETQDDNQRSQAAQRPTQRWVRRRHYKIQEVIKRRQVILVQVVKEERGNKGAALTTYLSLAGRYCVLMPNTPRGGGISRKITNANDRKRLKSAAQALELPEGMGLIIRTAGENRTKVEIKRDYEYLLRMWDTIRDLTLKSNAPACVYEEGDLIKRAIRDLYNKDVSEVMVEGDDGYRNAKDFMRMLMPSHAKNVKQYKEPVPLFQRLHIEAQLDAMFSPTVTLRSGGYVVINQTEALVAVDVNSGRATREHSIEDTAYKTNLEAAEEVARQLRLRDLAGLIVIDFIDMEDARNDRNVEKRLRDCVKNDRARVQIGKISQFGLLEMSRQRLRAGVVAGSTVPCPTCNGQGIVRSVESTALRVLRALDEEGQRQRANALVVDTPVEVAMYTLNQKRREIARMEQDYDITISFRPKSDMQAGTFELEKIGQRTPDERSRIAMLPELPPPAEHVEEIEEAEIEEAVAEGDETAEQTPAQAEPAINGEAGGRRRRRRRRRGRGDRAPQQVMQTGQPGSLPEEGQDEERDDDDAESEEGAASVPAERFENGQGAAPGEGGGKRRRRRRRRGRRGPREGQTFGPNDDTPVDESVRDRDIEGSMLEAPVGVSADAVTPNAPSAPVWSLYSGETRDASPVRIERSAETPVPTLSSERTDAWNAPREAISPAPFNETIVENAAVEPTKEPAPESVAANEPAQPARKGWWQRPFKLRD